MEKKASSFHWERIFVSGETIEVLFPGLPLDKLTSKDGLYDPVQALDLAEEMGIRAKKHVLESKELQEDEFDD